RALILLNCPFGGFKKTRWTWNSVELICWGLQKDKRAPDPGPIVLLEGSKRQKRAGIRSNCPFGGFKKTKGNWNPGELSFWGLQKDKRELESGRTVFLEGSKRQKGTGIRSNCPFECLKKTKESQTWGQLSF
ncbi:hypothetical protein ABES76_15425, partial [Heyndrickxia faecalis]